MKTKIKSFFSASRQYAVAGASNNPSKFGFKILLWYVSHDLPVIPINPNAKEILDKEVVPSITNVIKAFTSSSSKVGESHDISDKDGLSVSFLTPPHITTSTLKEIASVPDYKSVIKGLWFQPGSYDQTVLDTAEEIGLLDLVVYEDECILVRGEEGLYSATANL